MPGITLEKVPTVPVSPLPNQSSAETSFLNNYAKLGPGVLSARERMALSIIGLIHELKSVRGIDYTNNHRGLIQDSAVFTGGISMIDIGTAMAVVDISNGAAADATMSLDLNALRNEARDFVQKSEDELTRIITLLELQLAE